MLIGCGVLFSVETKSLPLFVLNSGPHTVHIKVCTLSCRLHVHVTCLSCVPPQSISVVPDNPSVVVEPTTSFLKPGSKYLKIASVTLTRKSLEFQYNSAQQPVYSGTSDRGH